MSTPFHLKKLLGSGLANDLDEFARTAMTHDLALEDLVSLLCETIPGMVYLRADDGRFLMANTIACDLYELDERQIVHPDHRHVHQQNDNSRQIWPIDQAVIKSGQTRHMEEQFTSATGQELYFATTKIPFVSGRMCPSGRGTVLSASGFDSMLSISIEITELKVAAHQIRSQSNFDPLTGLANRNLLRRRIKQAITNVSRRKAFGALLILDLDKFREVNEIFGHVVGDLLLKQVAETFTSRLSDGAIMARLSGDEFALLLPCVENRDEVYLLAESIIEDFHAPFVVDSQRMSMNLSIGISFFPDESDTYEGILKNTDLALSHAKRNGGHRYCFYTPQMKENIHNRRKISDRLRYALDKDQFTLFYQPVVCINTGEVVGMEALMRWVQLEKPFVSPTDFIPIAEQYGLIVPLGEWVLKRALDEQGAWLAAHPDMYLSVNVSSVQFQEDGIGHNLHTLMSEAGLNPSQLELELTESTIMQDVKESIETMDYLDNLGIGIAIDDFGTGYSSLSYLKRFPINKVKIDRSFIKDIGTDQDSEAITRAIVQLGHSLGLRVVAEGVEQASQLTFLRAISADLVQGFYYARPMPATMVQEWANKHNRDLKQQPGSKFHRD